MNLCVRCGVETRYSVDSVFQHKGECPAAPEPVYDVDLGGTGLEIPGPPEPGEDEEFDDSLTEEDDDEKPEPKPTRRRTRKR